LIIFNLGDFRLDVTFLLFTQFNQADMRKSQPFKTCEETFDWFQLTPRSRWSWDWVCVSI